PSASQAGQNKTVEVYGVYNPEYVLEQGCINPSNVAGLGGDFNPVTQTCSKGGQDITAQAKAVGCKSLSAAFQTSRPDIGVNADGDWVEVNTGNAGVSKKDPNGGQFSQPVPTQIQYEVISLLADPRLRPNGAGSAPFDGSDLRLFGNNDGAAMPARPRASNN